MTDASQLASWVVVVDDVEIAAVVARAGMRVADVDEPSSWQGQHVLALGSDPIRTQALTTLTQARARAVAPMIGITEIREALDAERPADEVDELVAEAAQDSVLGWLERYRNVPDRRILEVGGGVLLADVVARPVRWLWHPYIALGKTVLIEADPGRTKSLLTMMLAAHVTRGERWPNGARCELGNVVLINGEDDLADTIKPRLLAAGADVSRVLALTEDLAIPDDVGKLARAVQAMDARLVVIDPLTAFLTAATNTHVDHDVRRALRPVSELAAKLNVAVVVVRHLNKAQGLSALYRGGGSIGIAAAARIVLLVGVPHDDPELRVLAKVKNNLVAECPSMSYRAVGVGESVAIEWAGEVAYTADQLVAPPELTRDHKLTEAVDWLRRELADGARPAKWLTEHAPCSEHTLRRAKSQLRATTRRLHFAGPEAWVWELPDEGGQEGSELATLGADSQGGQLGSSALRGHELATLEDGQQSQHLAVLEGGQTVEQLAILGDEAPLACGHPPPYDIERLPGSGGGVYVQTRCRVCLASRTTAEPLLDPLTGEAP